MRITVKYHLYSRNRGGNSALALLNRSVSDCETVGVETLVVLIVGDVVKYRVASTLIEGAITRGWDKTIRPSTARKKTRVELGL